MTQGNPRHLILRTSWVFDAQGGNFDESILQAAQARDQLTVAADQWGAPTLAMLLAEAVRHMLATLRNIRDPQPLAGVYHMAPRGFTTWHEYAVLLLGEGERHGRPLRTTAARVQPVPSSGYPTRAARPKNAQLKPPDCAKLLA